MSDTTEEVYSRLSTTIEAWDLQISESHDAISKQLLTVRGHLSRLLEPSEGVSHPAETATAPTEELIASLEAEVAQLTEALQRAKRPAPPLVGGPPAEEAEDSHDKAAALEGELAEAKEANAALQAELDARNNAIETLRTDMSALSAKSKADGESLEALAALQQSMDTLQAALISAETRNSALEEELAVVTARADDPSAAEVWAERLKAAEAESTSAQARCVELEAALEAAERAAKERANDEAWPARLEASEAETTAAMARCGELEDALDASVEEASNALEMGAATQAALEAEQKAHGLARERINALEASLAEAMKLQATSSQEIDGSVSIKAFDSQGHKKRMGEILMELGVLDEDQLKKVLKEQSAEPQQRLGALVVSHGFTGEDIVAKILAAQLRLPYRDVRDMVIDTDATKLVSPHVAKLHRCLPLSEENGALTVAMVNPLDLIAIEDLELASRCRVVPIVSTPSQIDARLQEFYGDSA